MNYVIRIIMGIGIITTSAVVCIERQSNVHPIQDFSVQNPTPPARPTITGQVTVKNKTNNSIQFKLKIRDNPDAGPYVLNPSAQETINLTKNVCVQAVEVELVGVTKKKVNYLPPQSTFGNACRRFTVVVSLKSNGFLSVVKE